MWLTRLGHQHGRHSYSALSVSAYVIWSKIVLVWSWLEIFVDVGRIRDSNTSAAGQKSEMADKKFLFDVSRSDMLQVDDAVFVRPYYSYSC